MRSVRSGGKVKFDKYIKPMLATLGDKAFDGDDWIFEIKWDGYRAIAEVENTHVKIYSRNGLSFINLYPTVAKALSSISTDLILDGEIVYLNDEGKPDFQKLQQYGDLKKGKLIYYVFDCLAIDGRSIEHLPLIERKQLLKSHLPDNEVVKYADHISSTGIELFKHASSLDLEGIIAKRVTSKYYRGKRSPDWLKIKHHNVQEAIIVGFTPPAGSREYFGALILAIMKNEKLTYIGHTGTGFSQETLKSLHEILRPLIRDASPFATKVPVAKSVTWVEPKLVCNIKFSEITQGGILRHPVFMGLRVDKTAAEADRLERPKNRKPMNGIKDVRQPLKKRPKKATTQRSLRK